MGCWMMLVLPLCFFHVVLIYLQWEFITLTKTVFWTLLTLLCRYRKQLWLFYFSVTCLVSSTYLPFTLSTVPCWGDYKVEDAKPHVLGFLHIVWVFLQCPWFGPWEWKARKLHSDSIVLPSSRSSSIPLRWEGVSFPGDFHHIIVWILSTLLSMRKVYDHSIREVINSEIFFSFLHKTFL